MHAGIKQRIDDCGQVTIPKLIRDKYKIKPGDKVSLRYDAHADTVIIKILSESNKGL